jgi:hypothetical protein
MGVATGMTAERMLAIEASSVVDGDVVGDNLVLTTRGGTTIDAGIVRGPQGLKGNDGLNAATGSVAPVANTTPIRTPDGRVKTATPTETDDATTKLYVDGRVSSVMAGTELGAGVDLNTIITPGIYTQNSNVEASGGTNWPAPYGGVLEVFAINSMVWQRYTNYSQFAGVFWTRGWYTTTAWSPWVRYPAPGTLVQAGTPGIRTTDNPSSGVTTEFNICTVAIDYPINGAVYRVRGKANLVPETAGSFSELRIRHGVGAQTGGTQITQDYVDHRIASRIVCGFTEGQFTFTGTTGTANYNVVMTCINTSGVRATATSTRTATLFVDRVIA